MRLYQKLFVALGLLGLFALLAGCDQKAVLDKFTPKEEAAIAQRVLSDVIARNFSVVESQLDPSIQTPAARDALEKMAEALTAAQPAAVNIVGAETRTVNGVTTYNLTYEYAYPNKWLLANVMLQRKDGQLRIIGLHAYPESQSLAETNAFRFAGKSVTHYAVLGLTIAIVLFVLYALVVCFRTPIAKRKWLWLLFVALGFVQFFFNWTDGTFTIRPLSIALLASGFYRSGPYAPIILSFSIPVGAIVFLLRRQALLARHGEAVAAVQEST